MNDDEQLEQAIRNAEAELSSVRTVVALRAERALQERGLSNDALVVRRDERKVELDHAKEKLISAGVQKKVRGEPPMHELVEIFTAVSWFILSVVPLAEGEFSLFFARLGTGIALASATWFAARLHKAKS